ncbi:MAG TPA: PAS domain S-box protein, partial [Anaerolineales bacterium]|nr:PAS domain S-box protein [Anaerolineales bacterium]
MSNETLSQLQVELKKAQQKIVDLEAQLRAVNPGKIPVSKNNGGFVSGGQANDGARREKEKVNALFLNASLPKNVEDASQESEAKYRLLFEMMTQGVVFQDEAGRILHANPAAEKILGLTVEQMQGRSHVNKDWPSIHEDGSALSAEEHPVAIVMKTKQPVHNMIMGVFNPLRKSYIWLNINSVPRFLEGGTSPYQIFTTFEDITERKKIEFALRESEAKYCSLIDSQESAISTIDADGVIHYMNSRGAAPFGTPETVAGKKLYDLFPLQVAEWQMSQIRQVIESGKGLVHEYQNLVAGRPNWRRVSIQPIINADAGVRLATVNSLDITERKRAEEELRNSERKYRDLLNGMNDTVWVIDDDLSILDVNTAAVSTLGYTREELLSMRVPDFDGSLSPDAIQNLVNTMPADKFQVFQTEHTTKDGRKLPVEISSSLVTYNGKTAIMSIARDISERMQAEEKIRESESRYQQFVSLALEAISRTEFENPINTSLPVEQQIDLVYENAYIAECNQAMADMYDTTVESLTGKRIVDIHGGGDNLVNRNAIRKFIAGGYQSINNETKEYSVNGAPVWILNNTVGIVRDGMLLRLWETSIDITERKRAQEDLYLAEQRYRAMIEHAPDGIVLITVDGKFKYASPSVERIFGYVQEDLQALNSVSMTHPDDLPKVLRELQKLLEDQSYIPTVQYRFLHKNGEWRWIESTFSNLLATPNVEAIIINFRDIHERRLADEELKKSQSLLKESQRIGRIGYMEWSVNSPNLICSDEIYDIFNIPSGSPVTKDLISTMLRPDESEKLRELDHQATIHRADINYEYSVLTRDGNERCIHQTGKITYDETGNPIRKMLIVQDITERKQAEKQLQRNEQVLRLFVEHSPAAIAMFDREMRYIIASQRYLIDYRLGDQSLIGRLHYEVFPEMDESRKEIHRHCLAGEVVKHEGDPLPRVDGTLDWVRYELRPWYELDGRIGGLIFFSEVITERKQAEEKLRASEEKYRGLIESLGSIVATVDAQGKLLYLNDLAASSLGGSAAELTGRSMYDYFPPKYAESQMEAIRQVIESDKAVVFESQSYVQDELRWYRTSIQPI